MKHWRYLKYVLKHKYFVFIAGRKLNLSIMQLLMHDLSKFSRAEWTPYADYFYGPRSSTRTQTALEKLAFDKAWLHHQHCNPHHWQHYVLREDSGKTKLLPMPMKYILEMVADWQGAGKAITGNWYIKDWYEKTKAARLLDPGTLDLVEKLINA